MVLKRFFKSTLFSSFQRQLNYFGFTKEGGPSEVNRYSHRHFKESCPQELLQIRRKVNTGNLRKQAGGPAKRGGGGGSTSTRPTRPTHSRSGRAIPWVNKQENVNEHEQEEEQEEEEEEEEEDGATLDVDDEDNVPRPSTPTYVNDPLLVPISPITPMGQCKRQRQR